MALRPAPTGLPDPDIAPPVIAEAGDPFAGARILHLLARIPRGQPVLVTDVVDHLNASHLDWLFPPAVVVDVALQLRANWLADYRNSSGIQVEDGDRGPTITIEDSSRVDPWMIRQVERSIAVCHERLLEFSRLDRGGGRG